MRIVRLEFRQDPANVTTYRGPDLFLFVPVDGGVAADDADQHVGDRLERRVGQFEHAESFWDNA